MRWIGVFVLVLCLCSPQASRGFDNVIVIKRASAPPAAADCQTTDCLAVMDFQGAGCADGAPGGEGSRTCTQTGDVDTDCSTADPACPLEGTLSALFSTNDGAVYDDSIGPITTGTLTMDFLIHLKGATGLSGNYGGFISVADPANYECRIKSAGVNEVEIQVNDGSASPDIVLAVDTTYYGRLLYVPDVDDGRLVIWADDWGGATLVGNVAANGASPGTVVGYRFESEGPIPFFIVDDVCIHNGDLLLTNVHCSD